MFGREWQDLFHYDPVKKDIKGSLRLVKEGGIICGDDLNLQLHEIDNNNDKQKNNNILFLQLDLLNEFNSGYNKSEIEFVSNSELLHFTNEFDSSNVSLSGKNTGILAEQLYAGRYDGLAGHRRALFLLASYRTS